MVKLFTLTNILLHSIFIIFILYLYSGDYVSKDNSTMPMALFTYDLSPMSVLIKETSTPFYHFIISVCTVVGGAFVILRAVNNAVGDGVERLRKKKASLGKLT